MTKLVGVATTFVFLLVFQQRADGQQTTLIPLSGESWMFDGDQVQGWAYYPLRDHDGTVRFLNLYRSGKFVQSLEVHAEGGALCVDPKSSSAKKTGPEGCNIGYANFNFDKYPDLWIGVGFEGQRNLRCEYWIYVPTNSQFQYVGTYYYLVPDSFKQALVEKTYNPFTLYDEVNEYKVRERKVEKTKASKFSYEFDTDAIIVATSQFSADGRSETIKRILPKKHEIVDSLWRVIDSVYRVAFDSYNIAGCRTALSLLDPYFREYEVPLFDEIADAVARDRKQFIIVLNDYGFFLEQCGRFSEGIDFLECVLGKDPSRAIAYLNIGDAYGKSGDLVTAKRYYLKYCELMNRAGQEHNIPPRVARLMK